jgi:hypothetical protein
MPIGTAETEPEEGQQMSKDRRYIKVIQNKVGLRFQVRAANGAIITWSEHYKSKRALRRGIKIAAPRGLEVRWP